MERCARFTAVGSEICFVLVPFFSTMVGEMKATLKDAEDGQPAAITVFGGFAAANAKEINALTEAGGSKRRRIAEGQGGSLDSSDEDSQGGRSHSSDEDTEPQATSTSIPWFWFFPPSTPSDLLTPVGTPVGTGSEEGSSDEGDEAVRSEAN